MSFPTWACQVISLYALKPIWRDLELCWDCSFTIFRPANYLWLCADNILKMAQRWITESQTSWGWKRPLKVIWTNPPAQTGPPRISWPGPCPSGLLNTFSDREATTSLGDLLALTVKCFLMLSFCPLPVVLSQVTTEKTLAWFSLHPPVKYLHTLVRSLSLPG